MKCLRRAAATRAGSGRALRAEMRHAIERGARGAARGVEAASVIARRISEVYLGPAASMRRRNLPS